MQNTDLPDNICMDNFQKGVLCMKLLLPPKPCLRPAMIAVAVIAAVTLLLTSVWVNAPYLSVSTDRRQLPIYCTDRDDGRIALTFDAAWGDEDTPLLIDILARYQVKATFFVVGEWVDRCADSVKALHDAGHDVMNHSDTHPHMPQLSKAQMIKELNACNDKIEAITGVRPTLHRAPYGDYSNESLAAAEEIGMYTIQWDVDSLDWKDLTADQITSRVVSRAASGSIVLFHNAAKHTPEALPSIIEALQAKGYTFCSVADMIYTDNYSINHEGRQCKES